MAKASSKKAPKAAPKAARKPLPNKKPVTSRPTLTKASVKSASIKQSPAKLSKLSKLSPVKPVSPKAIPAKSITASKKVKIKTTEESLPVKPAMVPSKQTAIDKSTRKVVTKLEPERPMRDIPVAPPVPTDGKPRKNQAGLNARDLEHFRELLLLKRRELVGDMSAMEREALRTAGGSNLSNLPLHMADMGTDNYEQEFTLGLVEKDRQLLREINNALAKIQSGSYGICEGTGKPITKARLEAQPWAKFSIEWARQLETRQMIRR